MIGKAKSIAHGVHALMYMNGESVHKKHPERIHHVTSHLLDKTLNALGIWDSMKLTASSHPRCKNILIRIEISPAKEHTQDFTMDDWKKLWEDFVKEFDKQELFDEKGRLVSPKTNLANSKAAVWLHLESDSNIPHLHAAVCRIDKDGNINNDHNIHIRAQKAAEAVAIKRGWITPMKIREQNLEQTAQDCLEVLKEMPEWSWNSYAAKLKQKGYDIKLRVDSKRKVVGYVLAKGNAKYKASELGKGRVLTASRIETTWKKLRQQSAAKPVTKPTAKPTPVVSQPPRVAAPIVDYTRWQPDTTSYELPYNGETKRFYIPDEAMQIFDDEFDYRETANWQELIDKSVALFVGLSGGVGTVSSGGGGGSENDLPWGRDKDEDDREWARRCARRATRAIGIQKRGGMKR